jgi:hypothetical protein
MILHTERSFWKMTVSDIEICAIVVLLRLGLGPWCVLVLEHEGYSCGESKAGRLRRDERLVLKP